MKGPFQRLRFNLTRVWECQWCHHKMNTDGRVTTQMCDCRLEETGKSDSMRLISDGPRRMRLAFETTGAEPVSTAHDSK